MRIFNGTFALLGGFVGIVGMGFAVYNHTLDFVGVLLFGGLILIGAVATWYKVTGRDAETRARKGPLSGKRKKK